MVSNLFGDVFSSSFNVIGQLMKKCWLLLFSIKAVIGQFSSKWPSPSSCTVSVTIQIETTHWSVPIKNLSILIYVAFSFWSS